ncbi:peptidoglycan D,D-transpeptidase FtsI family protein [Devosia limi]|uniref:Cell division protein FtsI (Penicillin-binding protein 3) n=1 Tax=Devosia limi DSM 17137 TaxID=1121477 RepID=A0A1M4UYY5_9HYPH|nr:penicillin-binding protein 2 [Devosia limi]SHE61936.1 cell division protein FtsI (penicillin-binding protein 3) [Devosia limi DSM 17137]
MNAVEPDATIQLQGARKTRETLTRQRMRWAIAFVLLGFSVVLARLVWLGGIEVDTSIEGQSRSAIMASRPTILDRNGLEMALDLRVSSLFAEPRSIIDVEEATHGILTVLPHLDPDWLRQRLTGGRGFVWIARELSPQQRDRLMRLGIPGLDFLTETQRFYPAGTQAAHLMGAVNIDNVGIAGVEHYLDRDLDLALLQKLGLARGTLLQPVSLSVDMRAQHALHSELSDALDRYQAVAAAGAIMDVETGEVIALVSLPDFDPNRPSTMLEEGRFNRITAAKFEVGSIFKTITLAGALDSGAVDITDSVDARAGVRFGRHTISDYHGQYRILSVPEVYRYSSNIGMIRIVQAMGATAFREFLTRMGLDGAPVIELPEVTTSSIPARFSEVGAATASFGHGLSLTPLQVLSATSALVNGGYLMDPTIFRRPAGEAMLGATKVVTHETSKQIRYLMRLNALEGSGRRGNKLAHGYRLGGKTGTAEKVVNGRYSNDKVLTLFLSAFPMDAPRYAMIVLIDEPSPESAQPGRTAGWNAGEVSGRIVTRIAPMLMVHPSTNPALDATLVPPALI